MGNLVRVPIVHVVWRELEVPAHLSGVGVDGQEGARVEVVSWSFVAVPVRSRIPDAPVQEVELRVVGACQPGGASTGPPAVSPPGLTPRLAGRRHRVEAPDTLSGGGVIRVHEAADAGLRPAHADDDLPVDGQRRRRDGEAHRVVGDLHVPPHRPRAGVQRNQMRVQRSHVDRLIENGHAAVHPGEADGQDPRRQRRGPGPDAASCVHVEGGHRARRLGQVHDIAHHERSRLHEAGVPHLVHPLHLEVGDGIPVDLL